MALVTFDADPKAEVNAESLTTWRRVVSSGRGNEIVVGGRIVYSSNP